MKKLICLLAICLLAGCAHSDFEQPEPPATPPSGKFGYSPHNPIKVGDGKVSNGAQNQRIYLSSLQGPNGEEVTFKRLNACCSFKTPNGYLGGGLLDLYEVTYEGLEEPKILYLNMYDPGELKAPEGFILY